jgi:excinuclease ABC subunit A
MTKRAPEPVIRLRGVRHNNLKEFDLDLPGGKLVVITGPSGSGKSSLAFDTLYAEGQRRYIETFSPYARQFFDRMDKPQVDRIEGIPPAIAIEQRNTVRTTRSTVGTMTELCDYLKLLWPHLARLHCRQCGQPVHRESPQMVWESVAARPQAAATDQPDGTAPEVLITFAVPLSDKLPLEDSLALVSKQGYQRVLVDGKILRIEDVSTHPGPSIGQAGHLTVVQDRVRVVPAHRARFVEACEQAYHFGKGRLTIHEIIAPPGSTTEVRNPRHFSSGLHCARCDLDYREPTPALFSFNHPVGACPTCKGFGRIITIDYELALPDRSLTLAQGAIKPWRTGFSAECQEDLRKFCKARRVPMDVPFNQLPRPQQDWVVQGDPDYGIDDAHQWPHAWYGIKGYFRWLEGKAYKMHVRVLLSRYRAYTPCPDCQGQRLKPEALLYLLRMDADTDGQLVSRNADAGPASQFRANHAATEGLSLADFYALPIGSALAVVETLSNRHAVGPTDPLALVLDEVRARLRYLVEVGLGYLTLDRPTRTLSGGETERVNLTTCLGTRLVNTLFVLDEPSVGLHPRDTARLVRILERLRDTGNTVVVVEHEGAIIRAADQIVDLGPGSGESGGQLVFQGSYREILRSDRSLTGAYLSGRKQIEIPPRRPVTEALSFGPRQPARGNAIGVEALELKDALPAGMNGRPPPFALWIRNATRHNLKDLSVAIPLRRFVCLTGVSGSGKTTLVRDVLLPALQARLQMEAEAAKACDRLGSLSEDRDDDANAPEQTTPATTLLAGHEDLSSVVLVDQSPLGKTPRSNPAVYVGAFDHIRELFAQDEQARRRGLNASAFSFNSGQGQCERCRGAGFEKVEMQFLSDVFIRCPSCNGRRYREHILEVKLHGSVRREAAPAFASADGPVPSDAPSVAWSIADVLEATVDDVIEFLLSFGPLTPAKRAIERLLILRDVGLGYLRLGQPINTLSGGESQRLKLAAHLTEGGLITEEGPLRNSGRRDPAQARSPDRGRTLFLFDEPTTGLHFDDVRILLRVFQRLVDAGHSLLVIEHHLDVIKCADWVIDLGPEAGDDGGRLVVAGTPEDVAACEASHTGRFLRAVLTPPAEADRGRGMQRSAALVRTVSAGSAKPPCANGSITILGAREHNLKSLSLDLPRDRFVVVTGVSGSGKSTLAFDLLFAEGQRRFLDSMNTYARQFVEQMARPDVDLIAGLPPTVSIEQRTTRGGGKSTVATITEVYHFFRLLFARLGVQHCPDCQLPVEAQTRDQLAASLEREAKKRGDLRLLGPVVRNRKGFHTDVADWAAKHRYHEIRADGRIYDTSKPFRLDRFREHDVEIVVGVLEQRRRRLDWIAKGMMRAGILKTPQQLIDDALRIGQGTVFALDHHGGLTVHSTERACPGCGKSFAPLDPKNFSYNSAQGWCPRCRGFGEIFWMPEDVDRGERADAIEETWWNWQEGSREVCPECHGARLNPIALAVRLNLSRPAPPSAGSRKRTSGRDMHPTISDLSELSVATAFEFFRHLKFKGREAAIARDILPEILERLRFLNEVGLGYLQLGRGVTTLSGGEAQRIRLAAQLGSNLSGVLYILDEPTIGLHARDNEQLLEALARLRARGNSLVVVEHDEDTMRHADHIIDLGPGAGVHGGQLVASGTLTELMRHHDSVTGQSLRAQEGKRYPMRGQRRLVAATPGGRKSSRKAQSKKVDRADASAAGDAPPWLTLRNARIHNLKNLTVRLPLHRFVVITGVSGSGKSTLVGECLLPALNEALKTKKRNAPQPAENGVRLAGYEPIKAVYEVDQSPIGRTPRSVPATYVGFFDEIRRLFALTPEARMRGYTASRFSFNSAQGRCPECQGAGIVKLEMNFLPPAFVRCETCNGLRFNRETLDIEYGGRNISQVLDMSVEEAMGFFAGIPKIRRALDALHDTGLDYLKLGQTSPTLSGGEAQRVKLVTHLLTGLKPQLELFDPDDPKRKRNLFILEEPTIGLHMADVSRLVQVLQRLVDAGHSVIVIEHNLDLIAEADWVVDLGPEGGEAGGEVVVAGTPEEVARHRRSHTGRFLRRLLNRR